MFRNKIYETFFVHCLNEKKRRIFGPFYKFIWCNTVNVTANTFTIHLSALSTTVVMLKGISIIANVSEIFSDNLKAKLFPNPITTENVFIDFSNEKVKDLQLFVYNSIGQIVYIKLYKGQSPSLIEIPSLKF